MKKATFLLIAAAVICPGSFAAGKPQQLLAPGRRVVFLGDSITYAGHYVVYVEASWRRASPDKKIEFINVGLPSETASGLSEPDHPYPRPTVHERLDRVLAKTKPDVVFVCYGMNDGIYYPYSKERFEKYVHGLTVLIAKAKKSGAKIVLLTPPPFDPVPLRKKKILRPAGEKKYAWFAPYEKYDGVLSRFAEQIKKMKKQVDLVVDIRSPIVKYVLQKRKTEPEYTVARDGIHPNKTGHLLIANAILKAVNLPPIEKTDSKLLQMIAKRQFLLRDAWVTYTGHKRPGVRKGMPLAQAQQVAAGIDAEIRRILGKK